MTKEYPSWICSDCGNKHGRRECGVATWHMSACDVCGQDNVLVSEPRDYGHLNDTWKKERR